MMTLLFVWRPTNPSPLNEHCFASVLSDELERYQQAFGHYFRLQLHHINSTYIGFIHCDTGVSGWIPWVDREHQGIVWSGICEQFLDHAYDDRSVSEIIRTVTTNPEALRNWDGRFSICTWDTYQGKVLVTTGATEHVPLWQAEGPQGWAVGSRSLPLLALVHRQPEVELGAASIYAAYGYLAGNTGLMKGVTRIPSRRQIIFTDGAPKMRTYLSLSAYFADGEHPTSWSTTLKNTAERLVTRVGRQLKHSANPELLLTGGRDSRCIAAAAVQAGFAGTALTSGPSNTPDVVIASQVAKALRLEHRNSKNPLSVMVGAPERVRLWMQLSEGMEMVRQAIAQQHFFLERLPVAPILKQYFHGLGGEISRGFYYPQHGNLNAVVDAAQACAVVARRAPGGLRRQDIANELLLEVFHQIGYEMDNRPLTLAQWLDLFYWQIRCLHWGEDMMAVKDVTSWRWTPLLDSQFIRTAWALRPEQKASSQLIEDATVLLQPALKGIMYNKQPLSNKANLGKQAKHTLKQLARSTPLLSRLILQDRWKKSAGDPHLLPFWQSIFFGGGEHIWPELIDSAMFNDRLKQPDDELIWNLATVELAAQAIAKPV